MGKKREADEVGEIENQILYIIKIVLGIVLIIAGIAGLFLPIIPGIILIIIGLILLGNRKIKSWLLRIIRKIREKFE
jgi:uncharacterized protein YqgC (DUF456 family)